MEMFEMQCHANLQEAIRTVDGLGIEYDENVVCDVCRSVRRTLCFFVVVIIIVMQNF